LQGDRAGAGGTAGGAIAAGWSATGGLTARARGCAVACVVWIAGASTTIAAGASTLAFATGAASTGRAACTGCSARCAGPPPPAQPRSRQADAPRGPM